MKILIVAEFTPDAPDPQDEVNIIGSALRALAVQIADMRDALQEGRGFTAGEHEFRASGKDAHRPPIFVTVSCEGMGLHGN